MNNDTNSYKELYLKTAKDDLQKIVDSLNVLEKNGTNIQAVEISHLQAHSLKSASKLMGFSQIASLALLLETFFREIKDKNKIVTDELLIIIKESITSLQRSMIMIEETNAESDITAQIKRMEDLVNKM